MKIVVVGCGFLGSLFVEEVCKLQYALEKPVSLILIDDDKIEERNTANQFFAPVDAGQSKAAILAERAMQYDQEATPIMERVGRDNWPELAEDADLIIDAVDNIPTRQFLWAKAMHANSKVPVMHMGLAENGCGMVEWTTKRFDNFSLSPVALAAFAPEQVEKMGQVKKLPPCELNEHRGAGLNTAVAAVKSFAAFSGVKGNPKLISWSTNNEGHQMRESVHV